MGSTSCSSRSSRSSRWGAAAVALLAILVVARPASGQAATADSGRFEAEIRQFEQADRQAPPSPGGVVFVGSSSIRMWCTLDRDFPALRVLNRGFGGSELSDVLHYAERVVVPYRPRVVVLYAGDNDLASGKTPAQVGETARQFAALVHERLPRTRLIYVAVKPSPARVQLLPQVRATNALLRAAARRDSLATYVDVYTPMLGRDGRPRAELFGGDGLHMNSAGYALWRSLLAPALATR
jgi:lysophospholipase L1-like esterase